MITYTLTCFAMPKSANLTFPFGSTRMFAPLTSLQKKNMLGIWTGIDRCILVDSYCGFQQIRWRYATQFTYGQ